MERNPVDVTIYFGTIYVIKASFGVAREIAFPSVHSSGETIAEAEDNFMQDLRIYAKVACLSEKNILPKAINLYYYEYPYIIQNGVKITLTSEVNMLKNTFDSKVLTDVSFSIFGVEPNNLQSVAYDISPLFMRITQDEELKKIFAEAKEEDKEYYLKKSEIVSNSVLSPLEKESLLEILDKIKK